MRLSNQLQLARLFPLSIEEAAMLIEFERRGESLSEDEMIKAIRAMRGEALCTQKAWEKVQARQKAEHNRERAMYAIPLILRKIEKPDVVNFVLIEEVAPIVEAHKAKAITYPSMSKTTLMSPALEARFLAETTKVEKEAKLPPNVYNCDTCCREVRTWTPLNTWKPIYCPEHRFAAKTAAPCVIVEEGPKAPAPIAAQVVIEAPPIVEQVKVVTIYDRIGDRFEEIIAMFAFSGIKFGLTPPRSAAELEIKLKANPKWVALQPELMIENVLNTPIEDEITATQLAMFPEVVEVVPEPIIVAPKATINPAIWSKLNTGAKVRQAWKLLVELEVVNNVLCPPSTVEMLKTELKRQLGNDWMAAIASKATKLNELVN